MPRRYSPVADYSHLQGVTLDAVLDQSIRLHTYGQDSRTYPAEANADVLKLFGEDRDWISRQDVFRYSDIIREPRGWSPEFGAYVVGNTIGWGIQLELIEEAPGPDGERGYRLLHRETVYEVVSGTAMKVIGLPPAEQIAMNLRRSRLRRLHATLARKRAPKVRMQVTPIIDRLIAADRNGPIPKNLHPYLGKFIVDLAGDVTVSEVRDLLLDAHAEWDRATQERWVASLEYATAFAELAAIKRRKREAETAMSQEDIDAFAGI